MGRADFSLLANINVDDILLDEGNPRIRSGSSQSDCIARVLRKREQIIRLMKSIAEEGLSTVPILVAPSIDQPTKWVVKDGNRRMTALKLLNDPTLCVDQSVRQQISAIAKAHSANIPAKIDCLSSSDAAAIAREVVLRHSGALGGVGQLDWSAYLRTVYLLNNDLASEYKRAGEYLLWAESHEVTVDDDFPITTVSRFFSSENIEFLGFEVRGDKLHLKVTESEAIAMAKRVIDDFGTGRLKVDSVFLPESARAYLDSVRQDAGLNAVPPAVSQSPSINLNKPATAKLTSKSGSEPTSPNSAMSTLSLQPSPVPAPVRGRAPSKPTWDRAKLFWIASPQPTIPVTEIKARGVAYEIAQIKDVRSSPLTTAFLIRALVELSVQRYQKAKQLGKKGALEDQIAAACDSMLTNGLLTQSQGAAIKALATTSARDQGVFCVDTLQKYLHRDTHLPVPQTINTMWDELCPFVRACWAI